MRASAPSSPITTPHRPMFALGLRLFAIFCFSVMGILAKKASEQGIALPETIFWRQAFALPVVLVALILGQGLASVATQNLTGHLHRAMVGIVSMACVFASFSYLSITEATTLGFAAPIFATIMGVLFFKEKVGTRRAVAIGIGFAGVLVALQPQNGHYNMYGVLCGLNGALLVGFISHQIRSLSRTESSLSIVFWFSLLSSSVMACLLPFYATDHGSTGWLTLFGIGTIGGVAQIFMTLSLRYAPVSTVVAMDYSSILWAALADWIVWSHAPYASLWVGAAIIAASGLYIAYREHRLQIERADARQS